MSKAQVNVAIALVMHQQKVLVGWRESHQHQGNKHEFPGGKVESNESPVQACRREVFEEVGLHIDTWHPFDLIQHEYDDVVVNLHVFHGTVSVEQLADIHQPWAWYTRSELLDLNFPKANKRMLKALYWPKQIQIGHEISSLEALGNDHLLYWRADFQPEQVIELAQYSVEDLAKLIVNVELWSALGTFQQKSIAAIHLKQAQLLEYTVQDLQRGQRYIAACHDLNAAQHAQAIGCDTIFLSPVLATPTHPDAIPLGWETFAEIAQQIEIPVFALGGLASEDLAIAQQNSAYGIAGIRYFHRF